MKNLIFVLIAILLIAVSAFGGNYYVRKGATGSNNGTDWTNAWNELNQVNWSTVASGGTLYVGAGTYTTDFPVVSGSSITVKRATVSDHGTTTGWNSGYDGQVTVDGPSYCLNLDVSANNFTFDGGSHFPWKFRVVGTRNVGGMVVINSASNVTFRNLELDGNNECAGSVEDGFRVYSANYLLVEHCYIHNFVQTCGGSGHQDGVQMPSGDNATFQYNVFANCGMLLFMGDYEWNSQYCNGNISIHHNLFYADATSGCYDGLIFKGTNLGGTGSIKIENNVFDLQGTQRAFSLNGSVDCNNTTNGYFRNNIVYNSNPGSIGSYSHSYNCYYLGSGFQETGVITTDPMFANYSGHDYHILGSSPVKDHGTNLGYTYDIEGNSISGTPDMGAYEFTTSDTQAPSVPTGLVSSNITSSSFTLNWTASTDNVGVAGYEVFGNGLSLGTSTTNSISLTGLSASTTYTTTVRARDAVFNWSAQSTALNVTTGSSSDTQAPSVPTSLTSSIVNATTFTLSWTASTDNVGVTGYEVFKNGVTAGTTTTNSMSLTGLSANTAYTMTVRARDAVPNWSAQSTALNVTTASATSGNIWQSFTVSTQTGTFTAAFDAVPNTANMDGLTGIQNGTATAYSNLACAVRFPTTGTIDAINGGSGVYSSSATINYTAGTSYHIRLVINVAAHTYSIYVTPYGQSEITLGTNYAFRSEQAGVTQLTGWSVYAGTGTHSVSNVTFNGGGGDTQAPSIPTGLTSSNITSTSFTLSWTASTDNVGVTGYEVFKNGATIGTSASASMSVTGLTASTTYAMTVRSRDAVPNWSAQSTALNVTTSNSSDITIEAENFNSQTGGIATETCSEGGLDIGWISNGSYTVYNNVNFGTGATSFQARASSAASGGNIEIRLDDIAGTLVGTCAIATTGGWQNWTTFSCSVSGATGTHNLYLKFTGGTGYLLNLNWVKFTISAGGDTQAPSVPTGLTSSNITSTSFTLSWTASTDNVGVTGYEVFKNGASIGTSASASMSVTGLTASTTYSMTVRARDAVPNWSAQSTALNVTTSASGGEITIEAENFNTQSGGVQTESCSEGGSDLCFITNGSYTVYNNINFGSGATGFQARVSSATIGGNIEIRLDNIGGTLVGTWVVPVTGGWQTWTTVSCSVSGATGSHNLYLKFTGGSGNLFNFNWFKFTPSGGGDTQAPSVPTGLTSSSITQTSFTLSWTASTDNVGVTGYEVFKNGASIGTSASASMSVTGLTANTSYSMTVRARDAVPNWSAQSTALNVTTSAGSDTQAPSVPTGLTSSSITQTSFTLSWTASTDNVGVTGYEVFKNGASIGTSASASMSVTGLTANTSYSMTVRARDAVPNWSAQSTALKVMTASASVTSSTTWQSFTRSTQTGTFTAAFDAVPNTANMNGVTGIQNGTATDYPNLACAVRFYTAGKIEAINGGDGVYSSSTTVNYSAGTSYHFRLVINVTAHTYSIYVTPNGQGEVTLGTNYAFRSQQAGVTQLTGWSLVALTGTHTVSNMIFGTSGKISQAQNNESETGNNADVMPSKPVTFSLSQNYPNPFNPTTNIEYRIANTGFVSLRIYDVLGREVSTLVNGQKSIGIYTVQWDASNLPSGVYFSRLTVQTQEGMPIVMTKKILFTK